MIDIVKLLEELVAIPSMNSMGSGRAGFEFTESNLADFLVSLLRKNGIDCEGFEAAPGRRNVAGLVDVGVEKTLMLEAHLDTVPVDNMEIGPFKPTVSGNRLYGRGSCDTKASLAVFFGTAVNLLLSKRKLKYNLLLLGTCDEEYGFTGAQAAVQRGIRADFGIIGEPTRLRIVRAHKGVMRWKVKASGKASHSAYPELGENAIYTMAEAVNRIALYASRLRSESPHELLGSPSLSVGVIRGGHTVNIVPDSCTIEIDRRLIPGETKESVMDAVASILRGLPGIEVEEPYLVAPSVNVAPSSEIVSILSTAVKDVLGDVVVEGANYATDAGVFNSAGLPCVVFGPGDIADAHTSRESVELAQVEAATRVIERLLC